jgi:hypothetical protein
MLLRSDERSVSGGNRRMKQNACKLSLSTWLLVRPRFVQRMPEKIK